MDQAEEMEFVIVLLFFGIRILMRDIRLEGVPFIFTLVSGVAALVEHPTYGADQVFSVCMMLTVGIVFLMHALDIKLEKGRKKYGKYTKI